MDAPVSSPRHNLASSPDRELATHLSPFGALKIYRSHCGLVGEGLNRSRSRIVVLGALAFRFWLRGSPVGTLGGGATRSSLIILIHEIRAAVRILVTANWTGKCEVRRYLGLLWHEIARDSLAGDRGIDALRSALFTSQNPSFRAHTFEEYEVWEKGGIRAGPDSRGILHWGTNRDGYCYS